MTNAHNHDSMTHTAKCDEENCTFVAQTHAHTEEEAVDDLSGMLAAHNTTIHSKPTNAGSIKEAVKVKMQEA